MNRRKYVLLIATFLLISAIKAQTIESCVAVLKNKASEIAGQIKILNGNRFIVKDGTFSFQNGMADILWDSDKKNRLNTRFYPGDIDKIEIPKANEASPIGVIVIYFNEAVVKSTNLVTETSKYQKKAYFNFLQKDPKNAELIKNNLLQLKKFCMERYPSTVVWNSLLFLGTDQSVWTSKKSISYTYKIKKIDYSGCAIRLGYDLEVVSLTGTTNANYIAVIPTENIGKIVLDTKNSRPASYWIEGDSDIEIYKKGSTDDEYLQHEKQERVPLSSVDAEKGESGIRLAIEAALKEAVKCGQTKPFRFTKD